MTPLKSYIHIFFFFSFPFFLYLFLFPGRQGRQGWPRSYDEVKRRSIPNWNNRRSSRSSRTCRWVYPINVALPNWFYFQIVFSFNSLSSVILKISISRFLFFFFWLIPELLKKISFLLLRALSILTCTWNVGAWWMQEKR